MIVALLASHWAARLSRMGYAPGVPLLAALLIALHPFTLYTMANGPAAVLLMAAIYWLTSALADLRTKARVRDTMNVALALLVLAFTHVNGLIILVAALPFLALCTPPAILERSALGAYLLVTFPVAFAMLSFGFVRLTFGVVDWSLGLSNAQMNALLESVQVRGTVTESSMFFGGSAMLELAAIGVAALLAMPVLIQAAFGGAGRLRVSPPLMAMAATAVLSAAVAAKFTSGREASAALAPFIGIVPAALAMRNRGALPAAAAISVLVMGLIGGAFVVSQWSQGEPGRWREAMIGAVSTPLAGDVAGALAAGRFLEGKPDVLADTAAAPELAAGRGSARGLILSGSDEFRLALLSKRIGSRFVAVSDPSLTANSLKPPRGELVRAFPRLYGDGLPGYRRIYDAQGWRVYERTAAAR